MSNPTEDPEEATQDPEQPDEPSAMTQNALDDELDLYDPDTEWGRMIDTDWSPPTLDPKDEYRANGMLRALRALRRRRRMVTDTVALDIARTKRFEQERLAVIDNAIGRLERALEGFMRGWHSLNPKRKSLEVPAGILKLSAARESLAPVDPATFLKWAADHQRDDLIRNAPAPAVDKIKAATDKGKRLPDVVDEQGRTVQRWEAMYVVGEGDEREIVTLEGVEYRKVDQDTFKANPAE